VKGEIPSGVPGVFPEVGHGHDGVIGEMLPVVIAAEPAFWRRRRESGVAFEPLADIVVEILFAPQESGEGLALDGAEVFGEAFGLSSA